MSNKAPVWFAEFANKQEEFNKEIKHELVEIKQRLTNIENCPTIKAELQHSN